MGVKGLHEDSSLALSETKFRSVTITVNICQNEKKRVAWFPKATKFGVQEVRRSSFLWDTVYQINDVFTSWLFTPQTGGRRRKLFNGNSTPVWILPIIWTPWNVKQLTTISVSFSTFEFVHDRNDWSNLDLWCKKKHTHTRKLYEIAMMWVLASTSLSYNTFD